MPWEAKREAWSVCGHVGGDSGKAAMGNALHLTFFLIHFPFSLPQLFLSPVWRAPLPHPLNSKSKNDSYRACLLPSLCHPPSLPTPGSSQRRPCGYVSECSALISSGYAVAATYHRPYASLCFSFFFFLLFFFLPCFS